MRHPDENRRDIGPAQSLAGRAGGYGSNIRARLVKALFVPVLAVIWLLSALPFRVMGQEPGPVAERHAGSEIISEKLAYEVNKGDTLLAIAGRFGVELDYLVSLNPQDKKHIYPGEVFRVEKKTIVPSGYRDGILINIPDRTLYLFRDGSLFAHYPVGLGKPSWMTPRGSFRVVAKGINPTWHVPPSIQREMAREGEEVKTVVPPGPDNPLGRWALFTSMPGILIHETIAPASVYRFRSHGCIRMRGEDAKMLFEAVEPGEAVNIIYQPVKLAVTAEGAIYLEVQKDVYGLSGNPLDTAAEYIVDAGLAGSVDWEKVMEVALARQGVAEDVSAGTTRSVDGQEEFSEGGPGAGIVYGTGGGLGAGDGEGERATSLQHAYGRISDGVLPGWGRLYPQGAQEAGQPDEVPLQR